jgi:hypothetical protein
MFGRRVGGDFNPRRFWTWFAHEAAGLANSIEALARGEADAEWALFGLNERIHRYDPALEADVIRTLDGACQMTVSGGTAESLGVLLAAAPMMSGWRFSPRAALADAPRVPFKVAPRPSLDAMTAPIEARYQAYAHEAFAPESYAPEAYEAVGPY